MPTYQYECTACERMDEIIKPISALSIDEICFTCNTRMNLVMSAPRINTSNCRYEAHYNWGLGKVMKSPSDVKEELRRVKGETGKELVEVGNDRLDSVKVKRKAYTLD